ncbi:MAG: flippase-like domain-containing protein [Elusimicrobia bacterium]|nr:flippase-like domain-containing protein [Elusimicrobiota bacterium]
MKLKRLLFFQIPGFLISLFFLYLALKKIDFKTTARILGDTNYIYMIPAALAVIADFSLMSYRWKLLLAPSKNCRYISVLSAVYIGYFYNTILPMRIGEIIRAVIIGEKENVSKTTAITTIGIDHILNLFVIILLLAFTYFFFSFTDAIRTVFTAGFIALCASVAFVLLIILFRSRIAGIADGIAGSIPGRTGGLFRDVIHKFIDTLDKLRKTRYIALIFLMTVISWLLNAAAYIFIAEGMGIRHISWPGAVFITTVIALGIAVPLAPGRIGAYEYFGILACSLVLDETANTCMGLIALSHLVTFTVPLAAGVLFLIREHVSVFRLCRAAAGKEIKT